MGTEALVSLIVAILGLIFKTVQEDRERSKASVENRLQELRKPLAEGDASGISGALSNQHDRLQQVLRNQAGK